MRPTKRGRGQAEPRRPFDFSKRFHDEKKTRYHLTSIGSDLVLIYVDFV